MNFKRFGLAAFAVALLVLVVIYTTVIASSIQSAGGVCASGGGGAFVQISQQVLASPTASVTFSAISGAYTNLVLDLVARGSDSGTSTFIELQFNGDTSIDDYVDDENFVQSGSNNPSSNGARAFIFVGNLTAAGSVANTATGMTIRIPVYSGTIFWKQALSQSHTYNSASISGERQAFYSGGAWNSTTAITAITLTDGGGGNFVTGSTFTLYAEQ